MIQWLRYSRELLAGALGRRHRRASPAHGPVLFDRDALAQVASRWREEFERTSAARFRIGRMAMPHVLYVHWLAAQRECTLSVNSEEHSSFVLFQPLLARVEEELERIRRTRPLCFCINDDWDGDPEIKSRLLRKLFEDHFPQASTFESVGPETDDASDRLHRSAAHHKPAIV